MDATTEEVDVMPETLHGTEKKDTAIQTVRYWYSMVRSFMQNSGNRGYGGHININIFLDFPRIE